MLMSNPAAYANKPPLVFYWEFPNKRTLTPAVLFWKSVGFRKIQQKINKILHTKATDTRFGVVLGWCGDQIHNVLAPKAQKENYFE